EKRRRSRRALPHAGRTAPRRRGAGAQHARPSAAAAHLHRSRSMKRRSRWLLALASATLLLAGALVWLLATESGLRWVYARAHGLLPGTLDVQKLDGRLAGPLHIEGLHYRDASTDVRVDRLTFDWSPLALLAGHLHVRDLTVGGVQVTLPPPTDKQAPSRAPRFPLTLRVDRLELTDIRIVRPGGAAYELQALEVEVRIDDDRVQIDRLEALGQNFQ